MRRLQQGKLPDGSDTEGRWSNYLSTHPDMEERLRDLKLRIERPLRSPSLASCPSGRFQNLNDIALGKIRRLAVFSGQV